MSISIRHLKQIEAVSRKKSFYKAANELGISQPALSRSIALLEKQLGVMLFNRTTRDITLTTYGEHILYNGLPVLNQMEKIEYDVRVMKGLEHGNVVIGCGPYPAEISLIKAVNQYLQAHPKLNISIVIDSPDKLFDLLQKREVDFIVADIRHLDDLSLYNIEEMPQHQGYFACRQGHPILSQQNITVKDVLEYPFATTMLADEIASVLSNESEGLFTSLDDLDSSVIRSNNLSMIFNIVSSSDAICLVTDEILQQKSSSLRKIDLQLDVLKTNYALVSLKNFLLSSAAKEFQSNIIDIENQI